MEKDLPSNTMATTAPDLRTLLAKARAIRATCIQLAHDGREGHLNGALSCVEILLTLYWRWLRVNPQAPRDPNRDRLFFSKGHACVSLYAVLADRGFMPVTVLALYAQAGSPFPSHPCVHALPLLECSAGSLGHGLGMAAGAAYGLELDGNRARVVALISDGECNEGSTWEAATFAAANRLERLVAIIDYNRVQSVGRSDDLMGHTSLEEKFRSFGWGARTIDGHDMDMIQQTLESVPLNPGRPTAIIARTRAGAGVPFIEDQVLWHYRVPSDEDLAKALEYLGAQPLHKAVL